MTPENLVVAGVAGAMLLFVFVLGLTAFLTRD